MIPSNLPTLSDLCPVLQISPQPYGSLWPPSGSKSKKTQTACHSDYEFYWTRLLQTLRETWEKYQANMAHKPNNPSQILKIVSIRRFVHELYMYSKTCLIQQPCNPFNCVIRHQLSFPYDHAFSMCFPHCNTTPCLFRHKISLAVHVRLDRFYCELYSFKGNTTRAYST